MTPGSNKWNNDKHVAIIGAGFGGIVSALRLKKLGITNYTIYEKANEIGGTWRDNAYPGCAVDVSAQWYSISSEPNPNWSKTYCYRDEIWQYQKDVVDRNGLRSHLQLNSQLVSGKWHDDQQRYELQIERTIQNGPIDTIRGTGDVETVYADILIKATGGSWSVPKLPTPSTLPGIDTFAGDVFHSAAWRSDVDLHDKRVAVIGNGASATQIVPIISQDPTTHVVNFCRTPQWFFEREQTHYTRFRKWLNRNVPFFQQLNRFFAYVKTDLQFIAIASFTAFLRPLVTWYYSSYMKSRAPKELHEELTPKIEFGCRRVIRDPEYFESLARPNVQLEWGPIQEIVSDGIVLKNSGKHVKLDVIVTAIGFETSADIALPIRGRDGISMHEYWRTQGGPTAYRGTTLPHFPNMFMLLGPNSGAGHASVLFYEEVQADYMMQMIAPVLRKGSTISSVEVTAAACDSYNDTIQKKIGKSVWASCTSYYNQYGGKNVSMFPGFATTFWWQLAWPKWGDYIVKSTSSVASNGNGTLPDEVAHANGKVLAKGKLHANGKGVHA